MAHNNFPGGQILSELGQLGKQIGTEAAKAPVDIMGKALESIGTSSSGKGNQFKTLQMNLADAAAGKEQTPWEKIDTEKSKKMKQTIARSALQQLAGAKPKPREPSVWERIQMEAEQRKEMLAKQQTQKSQSQLPQAQAKRPRGDLYGVKAKRASSEMSRNVRQD